MLTLDSSVIIAALREQEEKHRECLRLLEKIKNAEYIAVEPYTVLVEVVAAIKRRTGFKELAEGVKNDLQGIDSIHFLDLDSDRANDASDIAKNSGVRGMDAIVIQIANEFNATLVSLDSEMVAKAEGVVKVKSVETLIQRTYD
ncbi:MAG: type II toxin-antitoxin system VapC family toxin [Candidatus Cloacimonetes bacterium]|nr:type II toxin-antitoxin system VapC family toxin [Candidatus Cloacimonadota bacterium]